MDIVKPSLRSAYLKVDRANECLSELKIIDVQARAAQAQAIIVEPNPDFSHTRVEDQTVFTITCPGVPIPDRIAILAGEVARGLRSALNYMTGQLSILDSGVRGDRTQFPIESDPRVFRGHRGKRGFLEGLNDLHVTMIEELQPYKGCHWTEPLRLLSNLDNHNDLVMVNRGFKFLGMSTVQPTAESNLSRVDVRVDIEPFLHVAMSNGLPVVDTLELLQSQVAQTLNVFNPFFGEEIRL